MKTTIKYALAFSSLAAFAGQAYAEKGPDDKGFRFGHGQGFGHVLFEDMDSDKTGDVTFDEFKKAAGDRFILADTNKDGKVTVEEMSAAIEKVRAERMAKRMLERLDIDDDGAVTQVEMDTNRQKIFARLDRNSDGKLVQEELKSRKKGWFGGKGRDHQSDDPE